MFPLAGFESFAAGASANFSCKEKNRNTNPAGAANFCDSLCQIFGPIVTVFQSLYLASLRFQRRGGRHFYDLGWLRLDQGIAGSFQHRYTSRGRNVELLLVLGAFSSLILQQKWQFR